MGRKRQGLKPSGEVKPIGAKVDKDLWNELRIQAIREGRRTGEILEEAIRVYLQTKTEPELK